MRQEGIENIIRRIQSGNQALREELIYYYRSNILEIAAGVCGRKLEWENDDELSISLLAFNEAIDTYNPSYGKEFHNYARLVIKSRLIDHFRKEARHKHLPLEELEELNEDNIVVQKWEVESAWKKYNEEQLALERAEEMALFQKMLQSFGISFCQLEISCPKHQDTREILIEIAELIASRKDFIEYVNRNKQLPLKELSLVSGISKKVIKRGRQYIIAVFLIISNMEFKHLRSFFSLPCKNYSNTESAKKQVRGWKGGVRDE